SGGSSGSGGNSSSSSGGAGGVGANILDSYATIMHPPTIITTILQSVEKLFDIFIQTIHKHLLSDGVENMLVHKVVQLYIDMSVVTHTLDCVWMMVEEFICSTYPTTPTLSSLPMYTKVRQSVYTKCTKFVQTIYDMMVEVVIYKVTALLDSIQFIDFEPNSLPAHNPSQSSGHVHEYIFMLVDYLTSTFSLLVHLPSIQQQSLFYLVFTKISSILLEFLISNMTRWNIYTILAFDADIKRLVSFAETYKHITPDIHVCFMELHQLFKVLLHADLPSIVDNSAGRHQHFPYVSTDKLATLIDKVRGVEFVCLCLYVCLVSLCILSF
ncbi:hypothetical protein EON63_08395, partial [archaeon]